MTELLPQYKVVLVKEQEIEYNHKINSVQDAITLMMDLGFADTPEEHVHMFCTDARGKIIAMHEVSHGTLIAAPISTRALFSRALLHNAAGIIIAHNHPSGDPAPRKKICLSQKEFDLQENCWKSGFWTTLYSADITTSV